MDMSLVLIGHSPGKSTTVVKRAVGRGVNCPQTRQTEGACLQR